MPIVDIAWAAIVLLTTIVYHICLWRAPETRKHHRKFACVALGLCILTAVCVEIFIHRLPFYEAPSLLEAVEFYAVCIIAYGGGYVLLAKVQRKVIKAPIQFFLLSLFGLFFWYQVAVIKGGYESAVYCPQSMPTSSPSVVSAAPPSPATMPNVRFWEGVFFSSSKECPGVNKK